MWEPPSGVHVSESERWAAVRLEQLFGAVALRDMPGAPERSHDFDVRVGEQSWAVEITSTTNPGRRSVTQELRTRELMSIPFEGVVTWVVGLHDHARVKGVQQRLPGLVADMVERGLWRLDPCDDSDSLVRELEDLGVQSVSPLKGGSEGRIIVQPGAFGGWGWQGDEVDHWLGSWLSSDQVANKLTKLACAAVAGRLLVVVLDSFTQPGLGIPLGLEVRLERGAAAYRLPTVAPPAPLTGLWLLPDTSHSEGLRWDAATGWAVLPAYEERPPMLDERS